MSNGLTNLRDYSRQELHVGTPPHFLFDENGRPVEQKLIELSLKLREVEALEQSPVAAKPFTTVTIAVPVDRRTAFESAVAMLNERSSSASVKILSTRPNSAGLYYHIELGLGELAASDLIYLGAMYQFFGAIIAPEKEGGQGE